MSDISKITHNNIIYDLKDTVGRNLYSNIQKWIDDSKSTDRSYALGLQVDYENKTFTRLGLASTLIDPDTGRVITFNDIEPYKNRRLCNLADDGTINAYYGDSSYIEDGSNGQVMVQQPKFYYKVEPVRKEAQSDGCGYHLRCANYWISPVPLVGFKLHPAFINEDGDEVDYYYTGAYEGSLYDFSESSYITDDAQVADFTADKLSSISGVKPISGLTQSLTRANTEQLAKNRGSGWHNSTVQIECAEVLLMMIEYGNMNIQNKIGLGVSSVSDNASYNCSALTGSTASIGESSGRATQSVVTKGEESTTYTANGYTSIRYRGRENPYSNIWKFVQGMLIYGNGNCKGGIPYICNDFSYSENPTITAGSTDYDATLNGYSSTGFTISNVNGYINAMGYGNETFDWLFIPSEVGGNSSLPVGDYLWVTQNLGGLRVSRLGGIWYLGASCGPFCWHLHGGVGGRYRYIGGRAAYLARQ